jgi:oxygen-independent coproporphyrinogen-3 oxidase
VACAPDHLSAYALVVEPGTKLAARVARGEVASPCTPADGYEAMRIAVAASRSIAEHRPVKVADVI